MKHLDPIRIVAFEDPPLVFKCFESYPTGDCPYPGYEVEYIHTVVNGMLGYPVQWIKANSKNEVEASLDNFTADMMGQSEFMCQKLVEKWGFPPAAYVYDSLSLLVRESYTNQSQMFILLKSFTWDLWSVIMVLSLVCLTVRHMSKTLYRTILTFKHFCTKSFSYLLFKFRSNVCYSVWFIFVSLLLNFYSNLIAVDLVAPEKVKTVPFKTLPELGEKLLSKECRFVILKQYENYTELQSLLINPVNSEKLWAGKFVEAYISNPPIIAENRTDMVDMVLNSSCVVGVDWQTLGIYYNTRYCDVRVLSYPEEIQLLGNTFYTTREDIVEVATTVILSEPLQAYVNYLNEKYYASRVPLECSTSRVVTVHPVNLKKIQDSFYLLVVGFFISFIFAFGQKCKALFTKKECKLVQTFSLADEILFKPKLETS